MARKVSKSNKSAVSKDAAVKPAVASLRLAGKRAVLTGGSRGIGFAIAKAFVVEGGSVLITGRDSAVLRTARQELASVAAAGAEVFAESCDVRDEKAVAAVFTKVKKRWGRLDILVNNAGISQKNVDVVDTPLELWRSVIDTNLTGMFLVARAAVPLMERGATIVNTLSLTVKGTVPKFAAYNASKMGALALTDNLRAELVSAGIRVTALIPGATDTEIWEQFWPDAPRKDMVHAADVAVGVLYAVTLPPQASVNELLVVPQKGLL